MQKHILAAKDSFTCAYRQYKSFKMEIGIGIEDDNSKNSTPCKAQSVCSFHTPSDYSQKERSGQQEDKHSSSLFKHVDLNRELTPKQKADFSPYVNRYDIENLKPARQVKSS